MTQPLIILGAGTFALETLDIAETAGGFEPLAFAVSLERPAPGAQLAGLPIYFAADLPFSPADCALVAGIASTHRRAFIETMLARGYTFTSVIHPSASISKRSTVGTGCVIHPGVIIASNTIIADHVILNRGSLIGHDNHINSFVTVGPGANLAGGLAVGEGTYIGVGAVIRDHLSIGSESLVAAGAVVVKSVAANTQVGGLPAQVMKTGVKGL
jgi:sugar O-acyltransferase (sialic acid O-acetyltransferase NeuD family)